MRVSGTEDAAVPIMLKGKQTGTLNVSLEFKGATLSHYGQVTQVRCANEQVVGAIAHHLAYYFSMQLQPIHT